jgi:serine/threonine protein kinase
MELTEGVVVAGRYRLVRRLATGGMGAVWLAHDNLLDAACALKLVDEEKRDSEEVRVRFEREARAAAQLRGAHVVDVFDHGIWEGIAYIAMEHLEGEDLAERLERVGRLEYEAVHRIIAQVSRALTRAHALGIVHRDLKPENIFLVASDDGEVAKVLDFGIARHQEYSLQDRRTKTGTFMGTPYYMSPEQARGEDVDYRSDLWALGVITWQCLIGKPPFESEALGALLGMIMYDPIPLPSSLDPSLPTAFDQWWQRATSRDREQRFQSAKELSDALGRALALKQPTVVQSLPPRAVQPSSSDGGEVSGAYRAPDVEARVSHSTLTPNPLSLTRGSLVPRVRARTLPKATIAASAVAVALIGTVLAFAFRGDATLGDDRKQCRFESSAAAAGEDSRLGAAGRAECSSGRGARRRERRSQGVQAQGREPTAPEASEEARIEARRIRGLRHLKKLGRLQHGSDDTELNREFRRSGRSSRMATGHARAFDSPLSIREACASHADPLNS